MIVLSFFIYVGSYYKPTEHALSYLQDSETVTVKEEDDYISFVPKEENQENGFIFYPGGKVDSKAYAPIMFSLAEEGISSYLLKVPFHLAFFDISLQWLLEIVKLSKTLYLTLDLLIFVCSFKVNSFI